MSTAGVACPTFRQVGKSSLPSLGVGPVTCAGYQPTPLVPLGNCNVETVRALAAVLRAAAAEEKRGEG